MKTSLTTQYTAVQVPRRMDAAMVRKFALINVEAICAIQERILLYAPQFLKSTGDWTSEITNGNSTFWILVAPNAISGSNSLEEGQWVGICAMHGPLSAKQYNFFGDAALAPMDGRLETRWIAGRLYIKPHHRSTEATKCLNRALEAFVNARTQELLGLSNTVHGSAVARVQATAYYGTAAHRNHQANGLQVVREVTRAEDLAYDGLLEETPEGLLHDADFRDPSGTLFEIIHHVS